MELKLVIASRRNAGLWKGRKERLINSNRSGVSRKKVRCAGDEWSQENRASYKRRGFLVFPGYAERRLDAQAGRDTITYRSVQG